MSEHRIPEPACWIRHAPHGTCLLPAQHEGQHEYTPDERIEIRFLVDEDPHGERTPAIYVTDVGL